MAFCAQEDREHPFPMYCCCVVTAVRYLKEFAQLKNTIINTKHFQGIHAFYLKLTISVM